MASAGRVVVNAKGDALATWSTPQLGVGWNRYSIPGGWGIWGQVPTDPGSPRLALGASGKGMAVWTAKRLGAGATSIDAGQYAVGPGFVRLDTLMTGFLLGTPRVAMDPADDAFVVWEDNVTTTSSTVYAARFAPLTGWSLAQMPTPFGRGAHRPQIACDANGNAFAVWEETDGNRVTFWSARYTAGSGWGPPTQISTAEVFVLFPPNVPSENVQVAVDPDGNALAIWSQDDGARLNIWSNRYVVGLGWRGALQLQSSELGDATAVRIGFDASGNALAVWQKSDGSRTNIWANRFE
jgi:hypothetical protein